MQVVWALPIFSVFSWSNTPILFKSCPTYRQVPPPNLYSALLINAAMYMYIIVSYRSVGDLKHRDKQRQIAAELQQRMHSHSWAIGTVVCMFV